MTVQEIFDLRRQGRIDEAYDAIRPMYAAHKGRYTTLCMFWTAADVFKLRLEQGRVEEATKIYEALKRMLPRVEEITKELDKQPQHSGHSAAAFIRSAKHRLTAVVPAASPAAHSAPFGSPAVSPSATARSRDQH